MVAPRCPPKVSSKTIWSGVRVAEDARLESVYTATYRGFESPPHRHISESSYASTGFFFACGTRRGGRNPDRGSTTGDASWTDREPAERAARRGERKRVDPPPHRHIRDESLYASTGFFLYILRRGDERPPTGVRRVATPSGRTKRANLMILSHFSVTGAC